MREREKCPLEHLPGEKGVAIRIRVEDHTENGVTYVNCPVYKCQDCGFTWKSLPEVKR